MYKILNIFSFSAFSQYLIFLKILWVRYTYTKWCACPLSLSSSSAAFVFINILTSTTFSHRFLLLSLPHHLHNYQKALPAFLLPTQTLHRQLLFLPSLSLYLILFLENSGFLCKSWRGARNNATFVLRGVHLVVTEISHLLCGPGVNGERQPLVTCKAFSKHHKNHQELPVCSVVNGNVGEINQRKTSDPLDRVTYLWAFRGHSDGCCSAGRIQHAFPVWCRFSCWGEPEELSRQLPAEEGSWRLRSKQKPGGRWGGGCHGEKKKKS